MSVDVYDTDRDRERERERVERERCVCVCGACLQPKRLRTDDLLSFLRLPVPFSPPPRPAGPHRPITRKDVSNEYLSFDD